MVSDVHYGMAGLQCGVQAVRVHVEAGERHGECGSTAKLFFATDVERCFPILLDGNQTGFARRAVRVAQIDMHVYDAHQSKCRQCDIIINITCARILCNILKIPCAYQARIQGSSVAF